MKNYIVDDMEVLADDIIFELASQSTEFKNISVIGHYEDIEPIIKELARYDDVYFISLEIGLRVGLAAFIAVAGQRVLPLAHMGRLDLVQRDFLEEGCHLQVDQPFLAGNG